jgi:hypothetical protein
MLKQVEDCDQTIERWKEVFDMRWDDDGSWIFDPEQSELWDDCAARIMTS